MTVRNFEKLPIQITAIQWDGTNEEEIAEWTEKKFHALTEQERQDCDDPEMDAAVLDELHSTWVLLKTGDWILKGVQQEFYPCNDKVFGNTYREIHVVVQDDKS